MDSTTHTTTTVEFVDWRAKAKAKLEAEDKLSRAVVPQRACRVMFCGHCLAL